LGTRRKILDVKRRQNVAQTDANNEHRNGPPASQVGVILEKQHACWRQIPVIFTAVPKFHFR
jgi:hypothetical protein